MVSLRDECDSRVGALAFAFSVLIACNGNNESTMGGTVGGMVSSSTGHTGGGSSGTPDGGNSTSSESGGTSVVGSIIASGSGGWTHLSGSSSSQSADTGGATNLGAVGGTSSGFGGTSAQQASAATGATTSSGGSENISGGATATSGAVTGAGFSSLLGGSSSTLGGATAAGGTLAWNALGVVQKGPFILGTTVTIQELDSNLSPTGRTISVQTNDDLGHFAVPAAIASRYVEILASGFFFDELTNQLSSSQLTLRAIADLQIDTSVNVNLLTSLSAPRERVLAAEGASFVTARAQAEQETLTALGMAETPAAPFDSLDISQPGDGNALLLASSLLLQGLARIQNAASTVEQLSLLIASIADDLASDGIFGDIQAADLLRCVVPVELDKPSIRSNLAGHLTALGSTSTIPDFEQFMVKSPDCCSANRQRCVGSVVQVCNDAGRWLDEPACAAPTPNCHDGRCEALCSSGEKRCSGAIAEVCDSNGLWQAHGSCSWGSVVTLQSLPPERYQGTLEIVLEPNDNVMVAWQRAVPASEGAACPTVWAAEFTTDWSEPTILGSCSDEANLLSIDTPRLAVSAEGRVLAAWLQLGPDRLVDISAHVTVPKYTIRARRFEPASGWSPTLETVSTLSSRQDAFGDPLVTYANETPVIVFAGGPGHLWSASTNATDWPEPEPIPSTEWVGDGTAPISILVRLLGTRDGSVYASEVQILDEKFYAAVLSFTIASGWALPHVFESDDTSNEVSSPLLAVSPSYELLVLGTDKRVWSSKYSRDEGWTDTNIVSTMSSLPRQLAIDAYGNGISIEQLESDRPMGDLLARHYSPQRGWSKPDILMSATANGPWCSGSCMLFDPIGNATVLWNANLTYAQPTVTFGIIRYSPATGWATPETLGTYSTGPDTGQYVFPVVTVDSKGRITLVWADYTQAGTLDIKAMRYE